jgi:hypothetical protein
MPSEPDKPPEPEKIPSVSDESPTPDPLALKEEKLFQEKGKSRRAGQREVVLHWVSLAVVAALGLTAFAVILIRAWHILGPSDKRWLSAQDLEALDGDIKLIATGGVGAIIGGYARKFFPLP